MPGYHKNNLVFRIASATAISQFKAAQAETFVQLSRKELKFDESAKEIVLLEFDKFSHWILSIEKIFIAADNKRLSSELRKSILESFKETLEETEKIVDHNIDVFTPQVSAYSKLIHEYALAALLAEFNAALKNNPNRAYERVVSQISNYLQHLLACMHEFNNNVITKQTPEFLSCSDFCHTINSHGWGMVPLLSRADYFYKLTEKRIFILKNYGNVDIVEQVQQYMADHNIIIVPEHSSELEAV
jgi:hypothetical protein